MTVAIEPTALVRNTRWLALFGLAALIVLGLAWELWLAPTGTGTLALKVLPLALCVAGLLRHRMYTFRVLSLLLWLYFMEGAVRAWSEAGMGRVLALIEVGLCLLLFAACTVYILSRLRAGSTSAAAAT
ncbi:MAG TPA: DUF2069 domain-containing protein [Rubrivivax sp.]|nr:DUF2069 domain-containing protein [Rubrivivax sp.]